MPCDLSRAPRARFSGVVSVLVATLSTVAAGCDSPDGLSDFDYGGSDEGPAGPVEDVDTGEDPSEFPSGENEGNAIGTPDDDDAEYVVNGRDAQAGEFPSLVSIQTIQGFHRCGGTVIAPEWILTAAHCVTRYDFDAGAFVDIDDMLDDYMVESGILRLSETGARVAIDQIIRHPDWADVSMFNIIDTTADIALLHLVTPTTAPPIALMTSAGSSEQDWSSPGTIATVVGWGALSDEGGNPDLLQAADTPIRTPEACQTAYDIPGGPFDSTNTIPDSTICAQGNVADIYGSSCFGDSGGPLLVREIGRYVEVGVVSGGKEGCNSNVYPAIYTRVSSYSEWIRENVPDAQFADPAPPVLVANGNTSTTLGTLAAGETDMYRIDTSGSALLAGGSLGILSVFSESNVDTYGTLFTADGTVLGIDDDSGAGFNFKSFIEVYYGQSPLYLSVRGFSASSAGNYSVVVQGPDPITTTATYLELYDTTSASAQYLGTITPGATRSYVIQVDHNANGPTVLRMLTTGNTDTYGTLRLGQSLPITTNDDSGPGLNFDLSANVTPGSIYLLEVRGFNQNTAGPYEVTITATR